MNPCIYRHLDQDLFGEGHDVGFFIAGNVDEFELDHLDFDKRFLVVSANIISWSEG